METLYLKFRCILSSNYYSHVVTIIHFTIQNGDTALDKASIIGHHKVVELLLGAGANPDVQDKVKTQQDSGVHVDGALCILVLILSLSIPYNSGAYLVARSFPTVLHVRKLQIYKSAK